MEIWRVGYDTAPRPKVLSKRNLLIALGLHVGAFVLFWLYAACHDLFRKDEEIIPIDLTVVVNENLNGKENEPPPLKKPEPEPPKPKVKPKPKPKVKEPDKPKKLEKIVTNIVAKVDKKDEKAEDKPKSKKEEPEKPTKTKAQLLEERKAAMRKRAVQVDKKVTLEVKNRPSGDGRTQKKTLSDAEIMKLLNAGYKPGTSEQIATSELQLGFSLVKSAFEEKWDKPPWTDTLKPMTIRVWFGGGGRVVNYKLEKSSGDARADQSIKSAASRVHSIPALPAAFIEKFKSSGVPVQFTVKPQ